LFVAEVDKTRLDIDCFLLTFVGIRKPSLSIPAVAAIAAAAAAAAIADDVPAFDNALVDRNF
jgi:hypothetical protein